ncbi:hypothetical protein MNEG_5143 [Monoraphidium neglectum]|uniref:Uncharacterized protein n=1 Tax=Monoraphidium neglectum TaxID=145388 RepID=A0A0D2NBF8_9CHLO|nr:hypothetical protein MNEG_5143 [Monoraphidium neglectum]KIZ02821.1 hypothetical protein MNEG_5143 [Monoraphidium neglectum]|eukprot:XP_013901840.1 hypothetical protein MNEG_5143 [Monoraphidium neglectum]
MVSTTPKATTSVFMLPMQQQQQQQQQHVPHHPAHGQHAHPAAGQSAVIAPPPHDHLRRVSRAPLKRRSTGLGGRGLSRNYSGKSQSFSCIQDLQHNPWAGDSALALAKRRPAAHTPTQSPGAAGARGVPAAALALPAAASRQLLPSWSIDEDEECLLGGVACTVRLAPASSGGSAADDVGDEEDGCSGSMSDDDAEFDHGATQGPVLSSSSAIEQPGPEADGGAARGLAAELAAALMRARLSAAPPPLARGAWLAATALVSACAPP